MDTPKILPINSRISAKNQQENIKKVAVTRAGEQALFLELDQNRPLAAIIQDISERWNLANPDNYALQFSEPNRQTYITERNRSEISNGNVLQLTSSPAKTALGIYGKLKDGKPEERLESLKKLASLSSDGTFAMEFINKAGHQLIIKFVVDGKHHGEPLSYILKGFVALMDHGVVSWDVLQVDFTKKVTECVLSSKSGNSCIQAGLEILECIVLHSSATNKIDIVENYILGSQEKVHSHLQTPELQKNSMALLNALFSKANPVKKKEISKMVQSKRFRNIISTYVIGSGRVPGSDIAHHLYVLQTLILSMFEDRMNTPADPQDPLVIKSIDTLRPTAIAIDSDSNQPGTRKSNLYRKLGFEDLSMPAQDFARNTPPGILALDNVAYFAEKHQENYVKVVLENSSRSDEHDCPFIKASIMLTRILCEILKIGEPPREEGEKYHPMFFGHEEPFQEFFCICIQLLNKTWREMRASTEDFQKVLGVVKEQIGRALDMQPTSLETFKSRLNQLTYDEIINLWERERLTKEEWESQARPIIELRKELTPCIQELIKQQRLNYLMEGTRFHKYNIKGKSKDKMWCWRLSPNHKCFHYADCNEGEIPTLDHMPNKLPVSEISSIIKGKDCPHVKEKTKSRPTIATNLAFAIQPSSTTTDSPENSFCFVAKDECEFDMWMDGLSILKSAEMNSQQNTKDLELLLNMEIKIRMLDAEGISIPTEPPPIPPEPDNYDFAYPNL